MNARTQDRFFPPRFNRLGRRWSAALLLAPALLFAADTTQAPARLDKVHRIVFVGDSITYADRYVEDIAAYYASRFPERHFEFINVGLSSETVSGLTEAGHAGGKYPRPDVHERLGRILEKTKPDLVFACYGMNDGIYQPFDEARFQRFQDGMKWLHAQVVATGAELIHVTPTVFDPAAIPEKTSTNGVGGFSHPYVGYNAVLDRYSEWLVAQRASGWEVIDLHSPMNQWLADRRKADPHFNFTKDGVHPDAAGHWVMARQILLYLGAEDVAQLDSEQAMLADVPHWEDMLNLIRDEETLLRDAWLSATGYKRPGVKPGLPLAEAQAKAADLDAKIRQLAAERGFPGKKSTWEGFYRYDFAVNGKPAIVVAPHAAAAGRPWAWRGEFFGAYANVDAALLARGFHIAYLRVPDLFGCPAAVGYWNDFYRELTGTRGLAKKVALIGLSRGGLYCFNWAIAHPDQVACIYADAPVADFKSWPGRHFQPPPKGDKYAGEWVKLLRAYGFKSDAEALAYRGNPVDNLEPLAAARVPLLVVYGDADTTVPWEENTGVIAARYRELGGSITLIPKPGADHHPHGLTDPAPIVDFILKCAATHS